MKSARNRDRSDLANEQSRYYLSRQGSYRRRAAPLSMKGRLPCPCACPLALFVFRPSRSAQPLWRCRPRFPPQTRRPSLITPPMAFSGRPRTSMGASMPIIMSTISSPLRASLRLWHGYGYGYDPGSAAAAGVIGGVLGGLAGGYPYGCDYYYYGPYGGCDYGDYGWGGYGPYYGGFDYGYGPGFFGGGFGRGFNGQRFGRGFNGQRFGHGFHGGGGHFAGGNFGHMGGFGGGHMGGFGGGHMGGFGGGHMGGGGGWALPLSCGSHDRIGRPVGPPDFVWRESLPVESTSKALAICSLAPCLGEPFGRLARFLRENGSPLLRRPAQTKGGHYALLGVPRTSAIVFGVALLSIVNPLNGCIRRPVRRSRRPRQVGRNPGQARRRSPSILHAPSHAPLSSRKAIATLATTRCGCRNRWLAASPIWVQLPPIRSIAFPN